MIPRGIRFNIPLGQRLQSFSEEAIIANKLRLVELGLRNIDMEPRKQVGRKSLEPYFESKGLSCHFPKTETGKPSFAKSYLEDLDGIDEAIHPLLTIKKMQRIVDDPFYSGALCGPDGRFTCTIRPMGADSGRDTSGSPNAIGIGKRDRPLYIAGEGNGLVELDFEQQEPLVAAALSNDKAMQMVYEKGDFYREAPKLVFGSNLSESEVAELREVFKVLVFGLLYGMGDESVAVKMRKTVSEARDLIRQFSETFRNLATWKEMQPILLAQRGFIQTIGGLRRYRGLAGPLSGWERRWAVNSPIQGSAGDILKMALLMMREPLAKMGARAILPVYDAVLIESPLGNYVEATECAKKALIGGFRYFFPDTNPRVDVNNAHPEYWNKPSKMDEVTGKHSLERFFDDPLMPLDGYPKSSSSSSRQAES